MKSHKTKAKEFFNKHGLSYEARADLEMLLLEHERDVKSVAVQLAYSHTHYGVDDNYNDTEVIDLDLVEELESLEVKDEE